MSNSHHSGAKKHPHPHAHPKAAHIRHVEEPSSNVVSLNENLPIETNDFGDIHPFFAWPFHMVEQMMHGWAHQPWINMLPFTAWSNMTHSGKVIPEVQQHQTEKAYLYDVALPGAKPEQISLTIRGGMLMLTAEEVEEAQEKGKHNYYIRSAKRAFSLPVYTNGDGITAKLRDGVLKITIPKSDNPVAPHTHHIAID